MVAEEDHAGSLVPPRATALAARLVELLRPPPAPPVPAAAVDASTAREAWVRWHGRLAAAAEAAGRVCEEEDMRETETGRAIGATCCTVVGPKKSAP
jgi:hypothetical protein